MLEFLQTIINFKPLLPTNVLTLASQSPRRRELLALLAASYGFELRLLPPDPHEDAEALEQVLPHEDAKAYVCRVTDLKAQTGWARLLRKGFAPGPLIASDTTVVLPRSIVGGHQQRKSEGEQRQHENMGGLLQDEILGKPVNAEDARRMLRALSNQKHLVMTAVTLLVPHQPDATRFFAHQHHADQYAADQRPADQCDANRYDADTYAAHRALSISEVQFGLLSEAWIDQVIASGEPMDKAGAYAIQGQAGAKIKEIKGSPSGIMGLPLFETAQLLETFYNNTIS
jgi:septum formation protein